MGWLEDHHARHGLANRSAAEEARRRGLKHRSFS